MIMIVMMINIIIIIIITIVVAVFGIVGFAPEFVDDDRPLNLLPHLFKNYLKFRDDCSREQYKKFSLVIQKL